ncbi:HEAT repeat domain-containing protein [Streptomyces sp. NPDC101160]|uniref:HEAT repeat domain-containing protein n=1 Tax=Streptomyces sp. NPDC101160 TaxID=3366118 RepID=UPI0038296FEB
MGDTTGRGAELGAGHGAELGAELVAAVRAGDADGVRRLLDNGADPNTPTDNGLPVLCLAVEAYDAPVAGALVGAGADQDRELPDGTTPLLRAIEGGSYAVFSAVEGRDPGLRLRGPAADRALATARSWYEKCRAAPGGRVRVPDGESGYTDELTLDGRTVRDGHGAILTELEWALRILTPVADLAARGAAHADPEHVDWWLAVFVLGAQRRSRETWSAVAALRYHPDPAHRRFAADVLRCTTLLRGSGMHAYDKETNALFAAWATEETDGQVLADVLRAWAGEHEHPDMAATGLRYADHPHPAVRAAVPDCLEAGPLEPAGRAALLVLSRDEDAEVRRGACGVLGRSHDGSAAGRAALLALARDPDAAVRWGAAVGLADSDDRAPEVADALAALTGEEKQLVRVAAAYGLLRRDDPRTADAYERVGPYTAELEHDDRWSRLWNWNRQRTQAPAAASADTSAAAEE